MERTRPLDGFWVALTGAMAVFLALAPLGAPPSLVGPDWLMVVLGYWCARRPTAVAPLVVFVLGLVSGMLRTGPIGAELFALLLICEGLRSFSAARPPIGFLTEWIRFTAALLALEALVWLMLATTYARTPPLSSLAQHIGLSILAYPAVAYVLEKLFRAGRGDRRFDHLR